MKKLLFSLTLLVALFACSDAEDVAAPPSMSINELMMTVITPATNALWGVEDPSTVDEWQALADSATLVIDAAATMKLGGSGPSDMQWAADPAWQSFTDTLAAAAADAYSAAMDKDLAALYQANDVLYPPCEECHLQFHPGVRDNGVD